MTTLTDVSLTSPPVPTDQSSATRRASLSQLIFCLPFLHKSFTMKSISSNNAAAVFFLALWVFALEAFAISPVEFTGALMLTFGLIVQGIELFARKIEDAKPELISSPPLLAVQTSASVTED